MVRETAISNTDWTRWSNALEYRLKEDAIGEAEQDLSAKQKHAGFVQRVPDVVTQAWHSHCPSLLEDSSVFLFASGRRRCIVLGVGGY